MLIDLGHQVIGHLGTSKITKHLRKEYYWKTMVRDVYKFCKSCYSCQTRKMANTKQYGKNHPLPIPVGPWQFVAMYFLINLPSSALDDRKYNSLMIITDLLAKMVHLIPTMTNVMAERAAKLYYDNIYRLHGLPRGIVSDRDTKFNGAFWRTLQKMVGTDFVDVNDGTSRNRWTIMSINNAKKTQTSRLATLLLSRTNLNFRTFQRDVENLL